MTEGSATGELLGTTLLLYVIVGSGIVVEQLDASPANALFFHAISVGVGLATLIVLFATSSGSHFNPAVTLAMWRRRSLDTGRAIRYVLAQVCGAALGLALATITFSDRLALAPMKSTSLGMAVAELIGTTVLVLLILVAVDTDRSAWIPGVVGGWVAVEIFSSSSTGLLNPAVTLARVFTDTYTGISPSAAPRFIVAQLLGALLAVAISSQLVVTPKLKGT